MIRAPKYPRHGGTRDELNARVNAYFSDNNLSKTGGWRLLVKALVIASWACASYVALLVWAEPWWLVGLLAASFGLAHAGIGFSIMHDGGHGASSRRHWATRLAAYSLDMIGGSSHLWAFKHNVIHHQYPNIDGVDHDVVVQPWLRLTDTQKRRKFHRAQYIYFPLAYTFLSAKWMLHDDFRTLIRRRLGDVPIPPMKRRKVVEILAFKVFALGWALALPIALHGFAWTAAVFVTWAAVSGLALATVFQLAHSVETTELTSMPAEGERLPRPWAEQQLATTMNFAANNKLLSWYVGGLNFQVEHHLFPRISHIHYPKIAPIVRQVCAERVLPYHSKPSFVAALLDHAGYLRAMGREPAVQPAALPSALPRRPQPASAMQFAEAPVQQTRAAL